MSETAAERFERDHDYRDVAGDDNHESGASRFSRNFEFIGDDRIEREYVAPDGSSALETAVDAL